MSQESQVKKQNRLPIIRERLIKLQGNMSNVDFAKKIGLSRQTVGFYINGDRIPDAETLKQICVRCNVSADYVIGLSDDPAVGHCAVDELGIPPTLVDFFLRLKYQREETNLQEYTLPTLPFYSEQASTLYGILCSDLFQETVLPNIQFYLAAKKAENILEGIEQKYLSEENKDELWIKSTGMTRKECLSKSAKDYIALEKRFHNYIGDEIVREVKETIKGSHNGDWIAQSSDPVAKALLEQCCISGYIRTGIEDSMFPRFLNSSKQTLVDIYESNVLESFRSLLRDFDCEKAGSYADSAKRG